MDLTLHGEDDRRVRGLAVVHEAEVRPRVLRGHRREAEGVAVVVEAPPPHRVAVPSGQPVLVVSHQSQAFAVRVGALSAAATHAFPLDEVDVTATKEIHR